MIKNSSNWKRSSILTAVFLLFCSLSVFPASKKQNYLNKQLSKKIVKIIPFGPIMNFNNQYRTVFAETTEYLQSTTVYWVVDRSILTSSNFNTSAITTNCPPFIDNNYCQQGTKWLVINVSGFCDG